MQEEKVNILKTWCNCERWYAVLDNFISLVHTKCKRSAYLQTGKPFYRGALDSWEGHKHYLAEMHEVYKAESDE
jgi:hypothetical protein